MTCPQLRTKTRTSISRKMCCVQSGFQILYAVEQLRSLFSKEKLKQEAHTHQTHDPPSLRMPVLLLKVIINFMFCLKSTGSKGLWKV